MILDIDPVEYKKFKDILLSTGILPRDDFYGTIELDWKGDLVMVNIPENNIKVNLVKEKK